MLDLRIIGLTALPFAFLGVCPHNCPPTQETQLDFHLVRPCQRSQQHIIDLQNTQTLEECADAAKRVRGLALNYAARVKRMSYEHCFGQEDWWREYTSRNRGRNGSLYLLQTKTRRGHILPFWQEPEEYFNCHVLKCPENSTARSLVNDSRFDYYNVYGQLIGAHNYTCLSEVGLFQLNNTAVDYTTANQMCRQSDHLPGALAHVASARRTEGLASLLQKHIHIHLAWVGLVRNQSSMISQEFANADQEDLKCFLYRAWAPGYPQINEELGNVSCVALNSRGMWLMEKCSRKLPFICELYGFKKIIIEV